MLKSLLERLKRDFDASKLVLFSLQEGYRFLISTCYFIHLDWLEHHKHEPRLSKFCNFHLEGLFSVRFCSLSFRSTRSLFTLKHNFKL